MSSVRVIKKSKKMKSVTAPQMSLRMDPERAKNVAKHASTKLNHLLKPWRKNGDLWITTCRKCGDAVIIEHDGSWFGLASQYECEGKDTLKYGP